jgi:WD40 repeat protein
MLTVAEFRGHAQVLSGDDALHAVFYSALSPDGTRVVTVSPDNTARLWESPRRGELQAFSQDGSKLIVTKGTTGEIRDARTLTLLKTFAARNTTNNSRNEIRSASFNRDGTRFITTDFGDTARVWDAETGTELASSSGIRDAELSADGGLALGWTSARRSPIRIWDAQSGQTIADVGGENTWIRDAAFSRDGTRVVTVSDSDRDPSVRV